MKGVILAGGNGSRLQPFTRLFNKHLLPVGPYPMIYWPIIKLKEAGIEDILIITNKDQLPQFEKMLGNGEELHVKLHYAVQGNKGRGIADALLNARNFIKEEKFVVILGDNIFKDSLAPYVHAFQQQKEGAMVLLKEVPDPSRYGVAKIDPLKNQLLAIIEKPAHPPSSYCVTGIYMYDEKVFELIERIRPSERNELEITDVNNLFIKEKKLQYKMLTGWWIDAGTHESLFEASRYLYNMHRGEKMIE